jgi:hypothetical protein
MWKRPSLVGFLVLCLLSPAARAGLYSTQEPPQIFQFVKVPHGVVRAIPPKDFSKEVLGPLLLVAQVPTSEPHQKYLRAKRRLEKKPPERRTVEDCINLSYFLIRLGQPEDALVVLKAPQAQDSRHFMVFSNLATAYQMTADTAKLQERKQKLLAAWTSLRQALRVWPKEWAGWDPKQLSWLQKVEKAQLDLIRLRLKEPPPKRGEPFSDVDHLFPIKFVGKNGKYGAGPFPEQPTDEQVAVVQQLLTWLPQDVRLYWLLGELLNAKGDVELASQILDNCVYNRGVSKVDLLKKKHWPVLRQAARKAPPKRKEQTPPLPPPSSPPAKKDSGDWLPGLGQTVAVAGLGAVLIGLLAYLQIRENRRRRLRNTAHGAPGPPP